MKKRCLWLAIVFVLLLVQAVTAYAQQASAYATILIIIPERPEHSAQVTEAANKEESLPEETHSEEETALLAKEEKD